MHRVLAAVAATVLALILAGCGGNTSTPAAGSPSPAAPLPSSPNAHTSDPASIQFCAQNLHPNCAAGTYVGPFVSLTPTGGHWDDNGNPVNGGPVGADRSTGNNIPQEYCARNEDPACPAGSYIAPNAIKNPDGSHTYVACEGTICTNPNHGGGSPPGHWGPDGQPVDGGPTGADGSTGNGLSREYCARSENPGCPVGTYVAPNAIENPNGTSSFVPCEGSICTNPNYGGGDSPDTGTAPGDDGSGIEGPPDLDSGDDTGVDDGNGPAPMP
ncbi:MULTISPECIES: hypothetical protein [unclassified Mycolicibacterium]|uniref:hypothetical protein n=1 Tax=Mycolicibacterium sp. 624 TaxID=3156314 RepID=UPI001F4BF053|nr:hypothetical protein [Mycolicibacterium sp. YH-1]UNB56357.1 hypothetical protein L0M16_31560 [Mycolicibacterium sp. YH-1]